MKIEIGHEDFRGLALLPYYIPVTIKDDPRRPRRPTWITSISDRMSLESTLAWYRPRSNTASLVVDLGVDALARLFHSDIYSSRLIMAVT